MGQGGGYERGPSRADHDHVDDAIPTVWFGGDHGFLRTERTVTGDCSGSGIDKIPAQARRKRPWGPHQHLGGTVLTSNEGRHMKRFTSMADLDFPVIDADAHVNEPPDLWSSRLPSKWRARGPQLLHTDHGDVWSFDEGKRTWELGLTATAGQSYLQLQVRGLRYDEIREASFEPKARLR